MKKIILLIILLTNLSDIIIAQNWIRYSTDDGLLRNQIQCVEIAPNGSVWIGTGGGVSKFDGIEWLSFTQKDGLVSDSTIITIAFDLLNNVWFGTWEGLSKYNGEIWTSYTEKDGLPDRRVFDIEVDTLNNIWIATPSGISKFDGNSWVIYTKQDGLINNDVHDIDIDSKGNMWFATWQGLSKYNGVNWINFTENDGLQHNNVNSIAIDDNDNIWCATPEGISIFDSKSWTYFSENDGLPNNYIHRIETDFGGNIWVVSGIIYNEYGTQGVTYYNGNEWTTFTKEDGLASNLVSNMAFDKKGNIWISTFDGLSVFNIDCIQSSIGDITLTNNLVIYPNPTTKYILFEHLNYDISYIEILDLNGRIVKKQNVDDDGFTYGLFWSGVTDKVDQVLKEKRNQIDTNKFTIESSIKFIKKVIEQVQHIFKEEGEYSTVGRDIDLYIQTEKGLEIRKI